MSTPRRIDSRHPLSAPAALAQAPTSSPALTALAAQIRQAHERCHEVWSAGLAHAIEAGKLLIEAKEQVGHGAWLHWLTANCPDVSERLAQRYMQIAREFPKLEARDPANPPRVADLTFRGALELLAENARTARKIPERLLPEVLEDAAQRRVENLAQAHQERVSSRERKQREARAEHAAETRRAQFAEEHPRAPAPDTITFCGFGDGELQVVLEDRDRGMTTYHQATPTPHAGQRGVSSARAVPQAPVPCPARPPSARGASAAHRSGDGRRRHR